MLGPRLEDGLRDEILTRRLDEQLQQLGIDRARLEDLEPGEGSVRLAHHLAELARRLVSPVDDHDALVAQVSNVNALLDALQLGTSGGHVLSPPKKLTGIYPEAVGLARPTLPHHPVIPLGEAELLSNGAGQPNLGQLVRQECRSADRVDLLCAFIGPTGVHTLLDDLEELVRRGRAKAIKEPLRVITSTWLGATKRRALDMLCELGAHVYVVFDGGRLRLHAKSWRFERPGGLSTAYVGSSNMSHSALEQGLEWNVRISERTNPGVIRRIEQTFEAYLADPQFERYSPELHGERLDAALAAASQRGVPRRIVEPTAGTLDNIRPHAFGFQERILEELSTARHRHNRHRNLVVAATGTGKTVIAAFDYERLAKQGGGPPPSLLFVAHREDILTQSRATFRRVLGRPEFGEILAGGRKPPVGVHVFANIQSLNAERLAALAPDAYDVVIVDEFHHAAAPSYRDLLRKVRPRELVGLTATPERADGEDITTYFDGHVTSELRLWEAIEQGLLAPFHYFGVDDKETNLAAVRWSRGRYDVNELAGVLTGDTRRVDTLITALRRYVPSPEGMRALGFCVSVDHAKFMAVRFSERGIPSECLHGDITPERRRAVLDRLENPNDPLRCVFSVDVLGEGVDVPEVDTLLLLRPTESATVFLQQLGRGLRLSSRKQVLTVLDMVSIPHERFRFDRALGSVLDPAGGSVRTQAKLGFPFLPPGCEIHFEREAHARVLKNLQAQIGKRRWDELIKELAASGPTVSLEGFLEQGERDLEHIYSGPKRSWGLLRLAAGFADDPPPETRKAHERLSFLLHVDDEERTTLYRDWLSHDQPPNWLGLRQREQRLLDMLLVTLWNDPDDRPTRDEALMALFRDRPLREDLVTLFRLLADRAERVTLAAEPEGPNPARVHARYTKEEGLIAFGNSSYAQAPPLQRGVYQTKEKRSDFFFVTLRKDEKTFSPSTRYRDYALGATRFHWETPHDSRAEDPDTQRYITHRERGGIVALFVRETAKTQYGGGAPFMFLGNCKYRSHTGSKPVQFIWDLDHAMPSELLEVARLIG